MVEAGFESSIDDRFEANLRRFLLQLHAAGVIDLHTDPTTQVTEVSDRPVASRVARWQAEHGTFVTTLRHAGYNYAEEPGIDLLKLLDGTRTRAELAQAMAASEAFRAVVRKENPDPAQFESANAELVEQTLIQMAELGLLEG